MARINPDAPQLIDDYIARAPKYARPICRKLRELIHKADPEIVEDWKWGPNFNKNGMICGIWAFNNHVTFTFYEGALLKDPMDILEHGTSNKHNRGIKYTSKKEIKEKIIISYIKEAAIINEHVLTSEEFPDDIPVPPDLKTALAENRKAAEFFDNLAFTYRKEFVNWIKTAKRQQTRDKRLHQAITLLERQKRMRKR